MEKARLGSAHGHFLHLGDFGEGKALDEIELCGEPLVGRQGREGLPDGECLVRRGRYGGFFIEFADPRPIRLRSADMVGAATPQYAESPGGEA